MQLAERLRNNDHLFSTDIKGKQGVCSPMLIELLTACIFGCVLTAVCVCVCGFTCTSGKRFQTNQNQEKCLGIDEQWWKRLCR